MSTRTLILKDPNCCKTHLLPWWRICCCPCRQGP